MKSPTEMSWRRYGSASARIFLTETIFLTNFERMLKSQKGWTIYSALFPLFIGEKSEVVVAQLALASRVASTKRHCFLLEPSKRPKWAWLLFAPPFTKYTPFVFFCWFLFEMLQNFMDYVTTPIFFPECCKTLWITQQCSFRLPECCGTLLIVQQCLFLTSRMLRNFTDYITMGVKHFEEIKRKSHADK